MQSPRTKLTRILSLDGGGIRGIMSGQVVVTLEEILQNMTGNAQARIADFFDLIAGTSTGGILTCLYLSPRQEDPSQARFSAQEAVNLYLDHGHRIFGQSWRRRLITASGLLDERYSTRAMEETIEEYFGDLRLSQLLKPCLIPTYDIESRRPHFFTQHNARLGRERDYLIQHVIRAATAAPSYFEVAATHSLANHFYPLIDGGVFANNPALCAYAEARRWQFDRHRQFPTAKDMAILSLGTGRTHRSYPHEEAKDWGLISWIQPLIDIMMDGVSETVDYQIKRIYETTDVPHQYLRISPDLDRASPDLDDTRPENLRALKEAGVRSAQGHYQRLSEFAQLLIANQ